MTTAYIFILAICDFDDDYTIRFHHSVVMADSPEEAYRKGSRKAEEAGLIPVAENEVANDYVIQLVAE